MLYTVSGRKQEYGARKEDGGLGSEGHAAPGESSVQGRSDPTEASGPYRSSPKEASVQERSAPRASGPDRSAPKEASAASSNTYVPQQNIVSEGCNFGPTTANTWQETHVAVENVVNIAEERHQEAMTNMASTTYENHQQEMAHLVSEARNTLQEQAKEHAIVPERQKHEACIKAV